MFRNSPGGSLNRRILHLLIPIILIAIVISPLACLARQNVEASRGGIEPPPYLSYFEPPLYLLEEYEEVVEQEKDFILSVQTPSGGIPLVLTPETAIEFYKVWGIEPWDHTYCAIALDLVGEHERARLAYEWLLSTQNDDGSWYSYYDRFGEAEEQAH